MRPKENPALRLSRPGSQAKPALRRHGVKGDRGENGRAFSRRTGEEGGLGAKVAQEFALGLGVEAGTQFAGRSATARETGVMERILEASAKAAQYDSSRNKREVWLSEKSSTHSRQVAAPS